MRFSPMLFSKCSVVVSNFVDCAHLASYPGSWWAGPGYETSAHFYGPFSWLLLRIPKAILKQKVKVDTLV